MTYQELIEAEHKNNRVRLQISVENEDRVAIEGDRTSLEFLGNLLLSFAREGSDYLNLDSEDYPLFQANSQGIILYRRPDA